MAFVCKVQRAVGWGWAMVIHRCTGPELVSASAKSVSNKQIRGFCVTVRGVDEAAVSYKVTVSSPAVVEQGANSNASVQQSKSSLIFYTLKGDLTHFVTGKEKLRFVVSANIQPQGKPKLEQTITLEFESGDFEPLKNPPAGDGGTETDDEFQEVNEGPMVDGPDEQRTKTTNQTPKSNRPQAEKGGTKSKSGREEGGSKEPKLLELKPSRLVFTPPYAVNKKKIKLQVKNVQQKQIAFKVRANSAVWRFFCVTPDRGVIAPDNVGFTIDFKMMDTFMQDELNMHTDAYTFQISTMPYPEKYKEFEEKVWADLEEVVKMSGGLQTTIVPAELKDDGKGVKFVNEPNTDKKYIDQPEPKAPEPKPGKKAEDKKEATDSKSFKGTAQKTTEKTQEKPSEKGTEKGPDKKAGKSLSTVAFDKIVQLSQETVVFDPPCGKDQSVMVAAKNIGDKKLAYKLQTNKKKYYDVKPAKGMLMPDESVHVEFVLKAALTADELRTDPEKAYFAMTVLLNIPKPMKHIDQETWKKFEQKRPNDVQKKNIELSHTGRKPAVAPPPAQVPKPADPPLPIPTASAVNLITVNPVKLLFKGPFGKRKTFALTLANKTKVDQVAYKVQVNQGQFYIVNPSSNGIIANAKSSEVKIDLLEKFNDAEFKAYQPGTHKFQITAVVWPKDTKVFDANLWRLLTAREHQSIGLDVDLIN